MQRIRLVSLCFALAFIFIFTSCIKAPKNVNSNYMVYDWNQITDGDTLYKYEDPYGVQFKEYRIFYAMEDHDVYAAYYSADTEAPQGQAVVNLRLYADDTEHFFITHKKRAFDPFDSPVFGKTGDDQFRYFDDYNQVKFLSLTLDGSKEYRVSESLSKEIWTVLKSARDGAFENTLDHLEEKQQSPYIPIYLYLKEVKAAVQVAILCEANDGRLWISNMNYTMFYPMPEKADNHNKLKAFLSEIDDPNKV